MKNITFYTTAFTGLFSLALLSPAVAVDFSGSLKGVTITNAQGTNTPPVAAFTYTINGDTVTFDASESHDPDGSIAEYKWDFGNGVQATGPVAQYQLLGGSKNVTLSLIDNENGITLLNQEVTFAGNGISDDFVRAVDENPIKLPWVLISDAGVRIINNGLMSLNWGEKYIFHQGVIPNNQYVSAKFLISQINGSGVGVRMDGSRSGEARRGYTLSVHDNTNLVLRRWVDGGFTNLDTETVSISVNDVLRLEVAGNILKGYINGVERVSATDSTYASGYAGLMVNAQYSPIMTNFAAGSL